METKEPISINYQFVFEDNQQVSVNIQLDGDTLEFVPPEGRVIPEWAYYSYLQCEDCPKRGTEATFCPVAANLSNVVEAFKEVYSYDKVDVIVTTKERIYARTKISMQQGLSSLLGIIMVTSGCENMDKLRPMVRFHLPFASIEETIFRAVSTYLLAQYFRNQRGLEPDWQVDKLSEIYARIAKINTNTVKRLQTASEKDAGLNAVAILDTYAQMTPFSIKNTLEDFEYIFKPYLK